MSNLELILGTLALTAFTLLVAPGLWSSYGSPAELLRKKWKDRADK
jgi:hypothetical protein